MWPFKRLSNEQRRQLHEHAIRLNYSNEESIKAFNDLNDGTFDLARRCVDETGQPLSQAPQGVEELVSIAEQSIVRYADYIVMAKERLSADAPAPWYPRRFHRMYEGQLTYFDVAIKTTAALSNALSPIPLTVEPGNHRVNVYVSWLGILHRLHNDNFTSAFPSQ